MPRERIEERQASRKELNEEDRKPVHKKKKSHEENQMTHMRMTKENKSYTKKKNHKEEKEIWAEEQGEQKREETA